MVSDAPQRLRAYSNRPPISGVTSGGRCVFVDLVQEVLNFGDEPCPCRFIFEHQVVAAFKGDKAGVWNRCCQSPACFEWNYPVVSNVEDQSGNLNLGKKLRNIHVVDCAENSCRYLGCCRYAL